MAFQPAPNCVEAKIVMSQNSIPVVNVFNVDVGTSPTVTELSGVFAVMDAFITSDLAPLVHPSLHFEQIVVTDISVANGMQQIYTPTTIAGSATGAAEGANVAYVASFRTAHIGRNYRGRTYMGGIPVSSLADAQHVTSGFAALVNAAYADLISDLVTAGYKLVVVSRWLANALRAVALVTEIISVITDTKIDSQRRRTAN